MRQVHRAGEKTFIDFSGKRPTIVDRRTGEERPVERPSSPSSGRAATPTSEATASQQLPDWVGAHTRMVAYFGGATGLWVPDQLKSAGSRQNPAAMSPASNQHLRVELAAHVRSPSCVPAPSLYKARMTRPRAESAVLVAQRCDPRPLPARDVLQPGRAERGHPRPARRAQRPPVVRSWNGQPMSTLYARLDRAVHSSPSPPRATSWRSRKPCRVNIDYRRRGRTSPLQRPVPTHRTSWSRRGTPPRPFDAVLQGPAG